MRFFLLFSRHLISEFGRELFRKTVHFADWVLVTQRECTMLVYPLKKHFFSFRYEVFSFNTTLLCLIYIFLFGANCFQSFQPRNHGFQVEKTEKTEKTGRSIGEINFFLYYMFTLSPVAVLQEGGGGRVGNSASSRQKTQFKHIYSEQIRKTTNS